MRLGGRLHVAGLRGGDRARPRKSSPNPRTQTIEKELARKLSAPVKVQPGERGRGKVIIQYTNLDQLETLLSRIK